MNSAEGGRGSVFEKSKISEGMVVNRTAESCAQARNEVVQMLK